MFNEYVGIIFPSLRGGERNFFVIHQINNFFTVCLHAVIAIEHYSWKNINSQINTLNITLNTVHHEFLLIAFPLLEVQGQDFFIVWFGVVLWLYG